MDTGLDTPQVRAVRKWCGRILQDPERLRLAVVGLVTAAGVFVLGRPEAARLAAAKEKAAKLEATAEAAEELHRLVRGSGAYLSRVPKDVDIASWQDYLAQRIEASKVTMRKIEPRKTLQTGPFRVVIIEVTVDGTFPQIVDFMDRIERGERIARLDRISFEKRAAALGVRFQVLGLVKVRA